jgi:hypothetical protein
VEDKFLDYRALTVDGQQASGMLVEESASSITLAGPEGKRTTLLRGDIDELQSTGKSLMPEGMEREITRDEMNHLLAYLASFKPQPKQVAGNEPSVVKEEFTGSLRLAAAQARIYGPTLTFEEKYRNLGYWQSDADHAEWTVDVPKAGQYRVTIDYACDNSVAGNSLVLEIAGQTLACKVDGTGNWDQYRGKTLGTVELPAGMVEVVVHPQGRIQGAVLDLRTIRLARVE